VRKKSFAFKFFYLFPTDYQAILDRIESIDPVAYARTRNFGDGAVSRLSPYFSRGVIQPLMVMASLKRRGFSYSSVSKFVQEMAWREYFQNMLEARPDLVSTSLLPDVKTGINKGIPKPLLQGNTGIEVVDKGIADLLNIGYMHNHLRMYTAALACNFAHCHWLEPARWMYYHLLDADPASNFCSWQWVAGCFNGKQYLMNQENINHFFNSRQQASFLDLPYERLGELELPESWDERLLPEFSSIQPTDTTIYFTPGTKVFVYDFFNLDPSWHAGEEGERILLMDTELLNRFPVCERTLRFTEKIAEHIPGIRLLYGSFEALQQANTGVQFLAQSHPLLAYGASGEPKVKMFPEVKGFHRSFSSFWKKAEPFARKYFEAN
jgi:deoxyribodipyrimidine photo-lyase